MALAKPAVMAVSLAAVAWLLNSILTAQGIVPAYVIKAKTVAVICLHASAVATLPLLVLIVLVMTMRLFSSGIVTSTQNPLNDEVPLLLKVTKAALNNTMEQTFVFIVSLLALSTYE
jgi:hypothetical protein